MVQADSAALRIFSMNLRAIGQDQWLRQNYKPVSPVCEPSATAHGSSRFKQDILLFDSLTANDCELSAKANRSGSVGCMRSRRCSPAGHRLRPMAQADLEVRVIAFVLIPASHRLRPMAQAEALRRTRHRLAT
jgi:hypothetical protein